MAACLQSSWYLVDLGTLTGDLRALANYAYRPRSTAGRCCRVCCDIRVRPLQLSAVVCTTRCVPHHLSLPAPIRPSNLVGQSETLHHREHPGRLALHVDGLSVAREL